MDLPIEVNVPGLECVLVDEKYLKAFKKKQWGMKQLYIAYRIFPNINIRHKDIGSPGPAPCSWLQGVNSPGKCMRTPPWC